MNYKEAILDRFIKEFNKAGKNVLGHLTERLKVDVSGDRPVRILQPGRQVKTVTIREIPAKVRLLSGQWVDVFKSTPEYDFQGGTPYAITDVPSSTLMICTDDGKIRVLFGGGVDATDQEVNSSYAQLIEIYNQIQAKRDEALEAQKNRPALQRPQINIQLPKVELPKIDMSQIRFQSPLVFGKKQDNPKDDALLEQGTDDDTNE